jgi:hypothetical protein
MGLLDDAIREHLKLKQEHGADPNEIAQQEHEALGGSVTEATHSLPAEASSTSAGGQSGVPHDATEDATFSVPHDAHPTHEHRIEDRELEDTAQQAAQRYDEPTSTSRAGKEPVDRRLGTENTARTLDDQSVSWYEDEDRAAIERSQAALDEDTGDVLGKTPDFLQETPEHDRLWFEQKPPRDFDFN